MRGPLAWMIQNPIAANLLMLVLIIGGVFTAPALDKQFFPTAEINEVSVTMAFPGAGPAEVEEQICIRIEEAIHDLNGIKEIRSSAMAFTTRDCRSTTASTRRISACHCHS